MDVVGLISDLNKQDLIFLSLTSMTVLFLKHSKLTALKHSLSRAIFVSSMTRCLLKLREIDGLVGGPPCHS